MMASSKWALSMSDRRNHHSITVWHLILKSNASTDSQIEHENDTSKPEPDATSFISKGVKVKQIMETIIDVSSETFWK